MSLSSRIPAVVRRAPVAPAALALVALLLAGCGERLPTGEMHARSSIPLGPEPSLHQTFPYSRFLATDGGVVELSESWQQQRIMLVFMRGFDGIVCPYCMRQTADLISRYDDIKAAGMEVYVVYPGYESDVPKFLRAVNVKRGAAESESFPFPLLLDVDLRAVRSLGLAMNLSKPATFVIDTDGSLIYKYVGSDYRDRPQLDAILAALSQGADAPTAAPPEPPAAAPADPSDDG